MLHGAHLASENLARAQRAGVDQLRHGVRAQILSQRASRDMRIAENGGVKYLLEAFAIAKRCG